MTKKDLMIDFDKKIIGLNIKGDKRYDVKELYSILMDLFDEPENMKYEIPIEASEKASFKMVNGWKLDKKAKKQLFGKIS